MAAAKEALWCQDGGEPEKCPHPAGEEVMGETSATLKDMMQEVQLTGKKTTGRAVLGRKAACNHEQSAKPVGTTDGSGWGGRAGGEQSQHWNQRQLE